MEKDSVLNSIFNSIAGIFNKGWDQNETTTKKVSDIYVEEIKKADDKLNEPSLTKKDKKYYRRQKERNIDNLQLLDYSNKQFIAKCFVNIGISVFAVYKIINYIKSEGDKLK